MIKKIPNYDNYYIYDNGDVINKATNKLLKGSIGENGYKYYRLSKNNQKTMLYAHRLVAESFLENPNNLPIVNHKDGNKLNNNIDNLEWVDYSANMIHAYDKNLIKKCRQKEYYEKDQPNEIWKRIQNLNYSVSNLGRVRNNNTLLLLKSSLVSGYEKVRLSNHGNTVDFMVHILVYITFHQMDVVPKGYVIDHINANKRDNRLQNLRMVTFSENVKFALYSTKTNSSCKPVEQLSLNDQHIANFASCAEAAKKLNLDSSTISKVCRGINKSHGGFHFKYIK